MVDYVAQILLQCISPWVLDAQKCTLVLLILIMKFTNLKYTALFYLRLIYDYLVMTAY